MRRLLSLFFCLPLLCSARAYVSSVSFVENIGQVTDQYHNKRNDIQFKVPGGNLNIFIGNGAIHYQFMEKQTNEGAPASISMYRMDVMLVGADPHAKVIKEQQNGYRETYYTPGLNGAQAFAYNKVIYQNVYPNIDWVIYTKNNTLKYEFVVKQGGNVSDIKMKFAGASALSIGTDGKLTAQTPMGTITEDAPFSYTIEGKREVASSFKLSNGVVSFNVGAYNGPLVIDPTLMWGTYFGASAEEDPTGMVTDASGNTVIVGYTTSTSNIASSGAHQTMMGGGTRDGFIAKYTSAGVKSWSTYYGGNGDDRLEGVAVDASGNIYAGGHAFSTGLATSGTHMPTKASSADQSGLLVKLNGSGTRLWATYYGGDIAWESITGVAYDKAGDNIYAIGSGAGANIATPGAHQENAGQGNFGFLVKFNNAGVRQWGTFYGGNNHPTNNVTVLADVAVNKMGDVYIVGHTNTDTLVWSPGASDTTFVGGTGASPYDMFVAKFNSAGVRQWGTYFGASGDEEASAVAVDTLDNVYIGGMSTGSITTPGAHQTTIGGGTDGIIASFTGMGVPRWATYYGGALTDRIMDLYVDATNTLYFGGYSSSTAGIASTAPWSYKTTHAGDEDGFVGRMNRNGMRLWASYYGGVLGDRIMDVSVTGTNDVVFSGKTFSTTDISTSGAAQPNIGGSYDYFLGMIDDCFLLQPETIIGDMSVCANSSQTYSIDTIAGATSFTWTLPGGWTGTSTSRTINAGVGTASGNITITSTNSCGTSDPFSVPVTVNPLPTPSVTVTGSNMNVAGTYSVYQWYKDGSALPGATAQSYTALQTGNYHVEVSDANGCVGQSTAMKVIGTNVKDVNTANALMIYPNPSNGTFTVSYGITGNYELTVTNVMGVKVFQATLEGGKQQVINLGAGVAAGNYFIEIAGPETKVHSRLTIK